MALQKGVSTLPEQETREALSRPSPRFCLQRVDFVPGFLKIFDEILSNASDQRLQYPEQVTSLAVYLDPRQGRIAIYNDGPGIEDKFHPEHQDHAIPLMLGTMFSSTNYEDELARSHAGVNGIGSKLTNIMSLWFRVINKHRSSLQATRYSWSHNMQSRDENAVPLPNSLNLSPGTLVEFHPDMAHFQIPLDCQSGWAIPPTYVSLLLKRVFDTAAYLRFAHPSLPLMVSLNGTPVTVPDLNTYLAWHQTVPASLAERYRPLSYVNVRDLWFLFSYPFSSRLSSSFSVRSRARWRWPSSPTSRASITSICACAMEPSTPTEGPITPACSSRFTRTCAKRSRRSKRMSPPPRTPVATRTTSSCSWCWRIPSGAPRTRNT